MVTIQRFGVNSSPARGRGGNGREEDDDWRGLRVLQGICRRNDGWCRHCRRWPLFRHRQDGKDIDEAIIVDEKTDKVIGASMCGPDAAEIMQGIAIALKCGAAKAQFDSTVGIHPSSAEEFLTMRSVTRRIAYKPKPKTNL